MNDNGSFLLFAGVVLIAFFGGLILGFSEMQDSMENEIVKRGYGYFDSNRDFQWRDSVEVKE